MAATISTNARNHVNRSPYWRVLAVCALTALFTGCTSMGAAGPSSGAINKAAESSYNGADVSVVELNDQSMQRLVRYERANTFAEAMGDGPAAGVRIGKGDVLDITIWEAPPAVLFGVAARSLAGGTELDGAKNSQLPARQVGDDGAISVPFVGQVSVVGRAPGDVEREIKRRLTGKANDPQVAVRLAENDARNVTVIGEVASSRRVPLGPRGERVLDALASAGGPRFPVGKTSVRLTREGTTVAMPLDDVIRDPAQNVRLHADDVLTVIHQPFSFIALGAIHQNAEIPFEGGGLSLAQALGRIGGLRDDRANVRGVFIFRLESPDTLDPDRAATARRTEDGLVPVIYRLNLADATSFFVAQNFQIRDKDVLYVSTAPGADFQRFLATLSSLAFSTIAIGDAVGGSSN